MGGIDHSSLGGALEHVLFFHILGSSSSQLTNKKNQRGKYATNQIVMIGQPTGELGTIADSLPILSHQLATAKQGGDQFQLASLPHLTTYVIMHIYIYIYIHTYIYIYTHIHHD